MRLRDGRAAHCCQNGSQIRPSLYDLVATTVIRRNCDMLHYWKIWVLHKEFQLFDLRVWNSLWCSQIIFANVSAIDGAYAISNQCKLIYQLIIAFTWTWLFQTTRLHQDLNILRLKSILRINCTRVSRTSILHYPLIITLYSSILICYLLMLKNYQMGSHNFLQYCKTNVELFNHVKCTL